MSPRRQPLPVAVVGALGRMGERVRAALAASREARAVGLLERAGHPDLNEALDGVPLTDDPKVALESALAVIDFSVPASTLSALRRAAELGVAYVCGTTGLSAEEQREVEALAGRIPVVLAPNFSVAVNVLAHLVGEATRLLGPGYDAEIVELHHGAKRDAPSGTALRLGEAVAAARGLDPASSFVLTRRGAIGARAEESIGIQTLRGGDNPGEHTVLFIGRGERLELIHRAATRDHFAAGALRAALWAVDQPPGLYGMEQVLNLPSR